MPRPAREIPDRCGTAVAGSGSGQVGEVGQVGMPRRRVLRLGTSGALLGLAAAVGLTGCSAEQREALLAVDPREIRLDGDDPPVPARPRPSARERRRRLVLSGSVAALRSMSAADDASLVLQGTFGGRTEPAAATQVHRAHVDLLLAGAPQAARSDRVGVLDLDDGGPVLPPGRRPAAVLAAGGDVALRASEAERAEPDADVDLAVLHARVAAARLAQADGLRSASADSSTGASADGAAGGSAEGAARAGAATAAVPVWPTGPAGGGVVDALQALLALEHRAQWSYGVVLAWSTERSGDARRARVVHGERVATLTGLVTRLGAEPVAGMATYPTDDDGAPVDGPGTATALALRLEQAVAAACAVVLTEAVAEGLADWAAAAAGALAAAERGRWSWGGSPQALPGG